MERMFLFIISHLVSIYSYNIQTAGGGSIDFNQYAGKKILLVNIASASSKVDQLAELQQLHSTFGDTLAIVAFPSNSFGNEPLSNEAIVNFCQQNYGVTFPIASKSDLIGTSKHPIYEWLNKADLNGSADWEVRGDYTKFLVDELGQVVGVFAPNVHVTDSTFQSAIRKNYNF